MKYLLPLFFLFSCGMMDRSRAITMDSFYSIDLQTSEQQVIATLGQPYATVQKEDGSVEFEYIERLKIGARLAEERHYYITLRDGYVVSKRVEQSAPLPFYYDSFDMQSAQNQELE